MHEFQHQLYGPLIMLANSYGEQQNFIKSAELLKRALQCFPTEFTHHLSCIRLQMQLAENYFGLGCLADSMDCVEKAMTICRQSMGVEKKLFQKLFPLSILYMVSIF